MTWALILASARRSHWKMYNCGPAAGSAQWATVCTARRSAFLASATLVGGARIGHAFGMEVIAWSQNLTTERAEACGARLVSKEELFRSGHPDDPPRPKLQNERLGRSGQLRAMKPSARLINTSRGPIVDEPALIEILRGRRIAGAASMCSTSSLCPRIILFGRWITSWPRRISVSSPETFTGFSLAIRSKTSRDGWPSGAERCVTLPNRSR